VLEKVGGPGEARTPDPLVANQVLSQLSYRPTGALLIVRGKSAVVKRWEVNWRLNYSLNETYISLKSAEHAHHTTAERPDGVA
jgi:hypothetical protein